jgi:hypothetical protein
VPVLAPLTPRDDAGQQGRKLVPRSDPREGLTPASIAVSRRLGGASSSSRWRADLLEETRADLLDGPSSDGVAVLLLRSARVNDVDAFARTQP